MSTTYAELGHNRTGIATAPQLTEEMVEGTSEFLPQLDGDQREIARVRESYAKEAEPIGSVPPPKGITPMVKVAAQGLLGMRPTQFMDKLGERLAFERTGVRLYEALLSKLEAFGGFEGGPTRADLEEIMLEEYEHVSLLAEAVTKLGGDPTVMTPSADLHATISKGILEVMVEPRTTFAQCLEAILVAELADNECWEALSTMAEQAGEPELTRRFISAREDEAEHLSNVRLWVSAAQNRPEDS
ncbi:MAG TPA: ferritin-like domain-containing protein [Polyangiaceae bacterium]|nr:ferritin-like domain-containing protein [Polyangiaceae bacterium]